MKAVEFDPEIRNRLSYAFDLKSGTRWQLRMLSTIHLAVQMSDDSEQLREKLTQASDQCREAIAIMDRELGIEGKATIITDKRKAR